MAISKLILNGEVQMDVTSDTVVASSLLSGATATKNDGTKVTGTIANKSSSDLTVSGATVTAPAGYYANAASKTVATATHPNPSASITSSTGVVTASHAQETGYVTGGTTTGTLSLTTQAGKTVTPTETAQTAVASYRWTTGPVSVAAISSTYVGTGVTTRSAADMTVAAQSVTAPAGYYSQAFTKAVTTTTHPNPTAAIVSSTGVVTATHTQTAGYVTAGTTTGTLNLTTQAAQTINTSTADQTIASNRWLTGTQTIKSVTTTNLTAANIAEGVVVKVGDANNASRITQITGTHSGATSYTATISGSGNSSYCYVTYNSTKYYTNGNTFTFKAGDTLTIYCRGNNASVNGDSLTLSSYSYTYTLPVGDITINLSYSSSTSNSIAIYGLIKPTDNLSITASGTHNTYKYSTATVAAGSAFPPAVTITKAPTIGVNTSGVVTASYSGWSSITPTVTSGYISQGTAGTISTTGTSTYQLTSQAAATYYPSTADQTIASQRWLVGNQTIKSVTTSNLTAENIAEGVIVKVGDSSNASRITQVTGTHKADLPFYNIYKTIATGGVIVASGTTLYSAEEIVDYCNSFSIISERQFLGVCMDGAFTFSNATLIEDTAFAWPTAWGANAIGVASYYFPSVSYIESYAFTYNSGITTIEAPLATFISSSAFNSCTRLSSISFPRCTTIGSYAFYHCFSISNVVFPLVTSIGQSAFGNCSSLAMVDFPSCTSIGAFAFQSCLSLTTISFPICTSIGSYAFHNCRALTTASFPSCTSIDEFAFQNCSVLTTASFSICTNIGPYAFRSCSTLTTISFPICTSIGDDAFQNCSALTTASFPSCTSIGFYAFQSCSALTTISFPICTSIGTYAFSACSALTIASFPSCTSIDAYAFRGCRTLLSLYLLGSSIPYLAASTVFSSTPIYGYTTYTDGVYGSIFVPASLYNSYITATNWSKLSSRFVSV